MEEAEAENEDLEATLLLEEEMLAVKTVPLCDSATIRPTVNNITLTLPANCTDSFPQYLLASSQASFQGDKCECYAGMFLRMCFVFFLCCPFLACAQRHAHATHLFLHEPTSQKHLNHTKQNVYQQ